MAKKTKALINNNQGTQKSGKREVFHEIKKNE